MLPSLSPLIRPSGFLVRSTILTTIALVLVATVLPAASPPDFRLKDTDGKWFSLKDHLGKDVIYISFWATWCVPCRREMPHLQKMTDDLKDQGFIVVSVNTDPPATTSKIKPYLRRHKMTFTSVLDPDNNVLDKYNPTRELPYGVLIDRQGNVSEIYAGYRTGDEIRLRKAVEALVSTGSEGGPEKTEESSK
jgi:peroxiredoxin